MTENKRRKAGIKDFAAAALLAAVFVAVLLLTQGKAASFGYAEVTCSGNVIMTLPLSQNSDHTVSGNGHTLHLTVKNGKIAVTESTCPVKVCVNTGFVGKDGIIICLPAKIIITVKGENHEYDAVI